MDSSWIYHPQWLLEVLQQIIKIGYTHVTVNHSKEFLNESNAACTNAIESDWRHAKVLMPCYGVHRGMHSGYLAEFM